MRGISRRDGRRGHAVFAFLVLALLIAACGDLGASPSPSVGIDSGIRGRVLLGPTCPGSSVNVTACLTPYVAQLVVLDSNNEEVARLRSAADGTFEVALAPGQYTIAPEQGDPYPKALPVPVIVVDGEFVDVEINYDSGVR